MLQPPAVPSGPPHLHPPPAPLISSEEWALHAMGGEGGADVRCSQGSSNNRSGGESVGTLVYLDCTLLDIRLCLASNFDSFAKSP